MRELITEIESKGHWLVKIRPLKFNPTQIIDLPTCKKLVSDSAVKLRGWYYPYIGDNDISSGNDWVEQSCNWSMYLEYWRFFQSGQFIHIFGCREDRMNIEEVRNNIYYLSENVNTFLSIISTVYTVTEIFEFTARLAQKDVFGESISISISLKNTNNRQLIFFDPMRNMPHTFISKISSIDLSNNYSLTDFFSNSSEYAIDFVKNIFERFNMDNPPIELFKEEQRKFLEKRI